MAFIYIFYLFFNVSLSNPFSTFSSTTPFIGGCSPCSLNVGVGLRVVWWLGGERIGRKMGGFQLVGAMGGIGGETIGKEFKAKDEGDDGVGIKRRKKKTHQR